MSAHTKVHAHTHSLDNVVVLHVKCFAHCVRLTFSRDLALPFCFRFASQRPQNANEKSVLIFLFISISHKRVLQTTK